MSESIMLNKAKDDTPLLKKKKIIMDINDTVKFNSKQVKVVAHRGLSGLERENTYPAFIAAGNRSYFGIETDVHVTNDGKFVVIHDETLTRVSLNEYDIDVEKSDYSVIENIILPDMDGSKNRKDIRVPLLIDYIKICKKYNKKCVLELKNGFSEAEIRRLVSEIESLGYIENVIFISFLLENCIALRHFLPDNKIQWLTVSIDDEIVRILDENRLDLDVRFNAVTKDWVEKLHAKGKEINCWTCDSKEDAEALVEMGVDYITSNILE